MHLLIRLLLGPQYAAYQGLQRGRRFGDGRNWRSEFPSPSQVLARESHSTEKVLGWTVNVNVSSWSIQNADQLLADSAHPIEDQHKCQEAMSSC